MVKHLLSKKIFLVLFVRQLFSCMVNVSMELGDLLMIMNQING